MGYVPTFHNVAMTHYTRQSCAAATTALAAIKCLAAQGLSGAECSHHGVAGSWKHTVASTILLLELPGI